jgi:hypothetical protein
MRLVNATRMAAGYTLAMESSGRELLVVVVKGTFRIPAEAGGRLQLAEEQVPLVMSDVFHGEPGRSAPKYEVDFAPRKPLCDVLLNGCAYAPEGQPVERVTVGLRVGDWVKSFSVVGARSWVAIGGSVRSTDPLPFTQMPITYDFAFGGVDRRDEDPARHAAFMANPSGRGFALTGSTDGLEGAPLPNTEELGVEVTRPDGEYRPMSLGPIGRHWEPRCRYAGTYDQSWLEDVAPFLPADFDDRYYQAAPSDQQLPLPAGEQTVSLLNLTPDGRRDFVLPAFEAPIFVTPTRGGHEALSARIDTILIEPDLGQVTLTWRIARALRRSLLEIAEVRVGRAGHA